MILRTTAAVAVLAALSSAALADTVTAKVKLWDPAKKQLILSSGEVFPIDPAKTEMPADLAPGDTVKIDYQSNDNGVTAIYDVEKVRS